MAIVHNFHNHKNSKMETVNQATGQDNQQENLSAGTETQPADLSAATNVTEQTETGKVEEEADPGTPGEPQADLPQAPVVVEAKNPLADLHDTYHSMKGSMSADRAATLGSKISNVIAFFEGHYSDGWKQKIADAENKADEAVKEMEMYKENAAQADKRVEFYEKQLQEASDENAKLREEITRLNTPSVSPAPMPGSEVSDPAAK